MNDSEANDHRMTAKRNSGFTLIEILVAINLAFIGLTIIISFYLFISKALFSTTNKIEINQKVYDSFYKMETLLKRSEEFKVRLKQDTIFYFIPGENSLIFTADKILIGEIYSIDKIDSLSLQINCNDATQMSFNKEVFLMQSNEIELTSKEINSFQINITKNKTNYSWKYYSPAISTTRFTNQE